MPNLPYHVGYCMNVHPASNLDSVLHNLEHYAAAVRKELVTGSAHDTNSPLGVGLWLSEPVVSDLQDTGKLQLLKDKLAELKLEPFTFNGFPQHNFHQTVVKHSVYLPTWFDESRLNYTKQLASIMSEMLPQGQTGSISTLPIGWPSEAVTDHQFEVAAAHLHQLAVHLQKLHESTGREVVIAIEPEPGCILGDSSEMHTFFRRFLLNDAHTELHRQYLTVCHDICHSAVMREDQAEQIEDYLEDGIRIGKIQVSSAIQVNWDAMSSDERVEAFAQVSSFAEDRYLHQTTTQQDALSSIRMFEDLNPLVDDITEPQLLTGNWAIHFHVPIHIQRFGRLDTTQCQILPAVQTLCSDKKVLTNEQFTGHFEIETYAWSVLPPEFRRDSLVGDIADEFRFFHQVLTQAVA
jgi:hypothetical protein